MTQAHDNLTTASNAKLSVLIVEDSVSESSILKALIQKCDYNVDCATNGVQALEHLAHHHVDIIVSDWKMPKMDGFTLCKHLHEQMAHVPYFILLTGRDSKCDLIAAMDAGADDFITKPYNREELRVRLLAGQRIVTMRKMLEGKNTLIAKALEKETETNREIQKDLKAAEKLQRSLLPQDGKRFQGLSIAHYFQAVNGVAGDTFNVLPLSDTLIAFYHVDVAGHGVRAAMHSFNITRLLSDPSQTGLLCTKNNDTNKVLANAPSRVLSNLNSRFQQEEDCEDYYTMIYGVLNLETGKGRLSQAGMPLPILQSDNFTLTPIGRGGFPIGMFSESVYEDFHFRLNTGDRLILHSDGIFSGKLKSGQTFDEADFHQILKKTGEHPLSRLHQKFPELMTRIMGADDADDDISIMILEKTPVSEVNNQPTWQSSRNRLDNPIEAA